jgi:hypothetical protein
VSKTFRDILLNRTIFTTTAGDSINNREQPANSRSTSISTEIRVDAYIVSRPIADSAVGTVDSAMNCVEHTSGLQSKRDISVADFEKWLDDVMSIRPSQKKS